MIIRAECLTAEDIAGIQAAYGDDFDSMINALEGEEGSTIAAGVNAEDLLAYVLESDCTDLMNPDAAGMDAVWGLTSVQDMLKDLYDKNYVGTDVDQEQLVDDVKNYLDNECGIPMDILNQVIDLANKKIAEYGPILFGPDAASELQNLITAMKYINPGVYLLLYVMYELGEKMSTAIQDVVEAREASSEALIDKMEAIEDFEEGDDNESSIETQQAIKALDYEIQNLQSQIKSYDELTKTLLETLEQAIETASNMTQQQSRTVNSILQNW
ncbi:MAG: hypothetical protein HQM16_07130 [Deltaproteobacteria bacterium]|nr:hypothetical protein [Deltaproteobacteria bacterium]